MFLEVKISPSMAADTIILEIDKKLRPHGFRNVGELLEVDLWVSRSFYYELDHEIEKPPRYTLREVDGWIRNIQAGRTETTECYLVGEGIQESLRRSTQAEPKEMPMIQKPPRPLPQERL